MDPKHIISFKNGTLYIKLREDFNASTMEIHCTLAEITRTSVKVVKADSKGEVSSTSMTLNAQEWVRLSKGVEMVKAFWEQRLEYRSMLLECGCITTWTQDEKLPIIGDWVWCCNHDEAKIFRFNVSDFVALAEAEAEDVMPDDDLIYRQEVERGLHSR